MSGTANREIDYKCDGCGEHFAKSDLFAKQARFMAVGVRGRHIRTRTLKWLCGGCLLDDPDYNLEQWARNRTPGIKAAS